MNVMKHKIRKKDRERFLKACERLDNVILDIKKYCPDVMVFSECGGLILSNSGEINSDENTVYDEEAMMEEHYYMNCHWDSGAF